MPGLREKAIHSKIARTRAEINHVDALLPKMHYSEIGRQNLFSGTIVSLPSERYNVLYDHLRDLKSTLKTIRGPAKKHLEAALQLAESEEGTKYERGKLISQIEESLRKNRKELLKRLAKHERDFEKFEKNRKRKVTLEQVRRKIGKLK